MLVLTVLNLTSTQQANKTTRAPKVLRPLVRLQASNTPNGGNFSLYTAMTAGVVISANPSTKKTNPKAMVVLSTIAKSKEKALKCFRKKGAPSIKVDPTSNKQ